MHRYLFQGLMQAGWMLAMVWPAMVWSQGTEPASSPPPVATMTVQQPSLTAQSGGAQVLAGQVSVSLPMLSPGLEVVLCETTVLDVAVRLTTTLVDVTVRLVAVVLNVVTVTVVVTVEVVMVAFGM